MHTTYIAASLSQEPKKLALTMAPNSASTLLL